MNFCNYCYTRMDACETCKDAIIAEKDKEIARLRTSLNCSGCGEDIQNIVEQSALLKEKEAEITALKAKIHRMSKCFYFWDQYEGRKNEV